MADAGIIRNRLKINAAIYNAQQIKQLQKEFGSFRKWLDVQKGVIESGVCVIPVKAGIQVRISGAKTLDPNFHWGDNADTEIKKTWVKLFKKHFKFVGGEIVGEFLMSIAMLPGSHGEECFRFHLK